MIENNEMEQVANSLHYCNCTVTSLCQKHDNNNEKMAEYYKVGLSNDYCCK